MRQHDVRYLARRLVEPMTLEPLQTDGVNLTTQTGAPVTIVAGVPVFGRTQLSSSQLAELSFDHRWLAEQREKGGGVASAPSNINSNSWWLKWIDATALTAPESVLVCLGGAFGDDLPNVHAANKFNVDHLADVYTEIAALEVEKQDITFVSCPAETLPFASGTVDIVYSCNALDHFDNPLKVLEEVHRILRPDGTFLFACYFDSTFLDAAETKIVDHDFVDRYVSALFKEVHRDLQAMPPQIVVGPPRTRFLSYVGHPRVTGRLPVSAETIEWSARLANEFQRALAERVGESPSAAKEAFAATLEAPPVMPTDAHRQVFAALQLLAMRDDNALLAAARTIVEHGLADDWREVANLVLNLYAWSLDDLPTMEGATTIKVDPYFEEWQWFATLALSAAALDRKDAAAALRSTAILSNERARAWIDGAEFLMPIGRIGRTLRRISMRADSLGRQVRSALAR